MIQTASGKIDHRFMWKTRDEKGIQNKNKKKAKSLLLTDKKNLNLNGQDKRRNKEGKNNVKSK